mgnify:CR=1 FL=1
MKLKNKNKILVVGGTGFIGYHLIKKLIKLKFDVDSISTKKPKKTRRVEKVKYILSDISNKTKLLKNIKTPYEFVVNLGGHVNHTNKLKTYNSHYLGCKNIIQTLIKKNIQIKKFVQIGSCVEYGRINSPQKESTKINKNNLKSTYGKSKLKSSLFLLSYFKKYNFPCTILRLYLAYGPKQDFNRFLPVIIKSCLNKKKFACSEGNQLRDFTHIDDVTNAIVKSLFNKKTNGQIINIGTGNPIKIKTVIERVRKITKGGKPNYGAIKLRKDEIIKLYPSTKKAKKILNWKAKTNFNKGLKRTINFYKQNLNFQ